MTITEKPASLFHIAKAMKCIATVREELGNIDWENEQALGVAIVSLVFAHPDEILKAIFYINREEATLEEIQGIEDAQELEKLVTQLIANNRGNVETFMSFLGKAMSGELEALASPKA